MPLGVFGGSAPHALRVSAGGSPSMGDLAQLTKEQATGKFGDLPVGYRDLGVRAFNSANISISNNTTTAITLDSERWDTGELHSTSVNTSRITLTTAGNYLIVGIIEWGANATGSRQVQIRRNGDSATNIGIITQGATPGGAGFVTTQVISIYYQLVVGDFIELFVYQDSGGALNVLNSATYSPEFMVVKLP